MENKLYPNPFNARTAIRYDLAESTKVVLKIFNLLGQEVRTLVKETQTAGAKQAAWDGRDCSGKQVSSGIYVYILEAGSFMDKRKMIFLK